MPYREKVKLVEALRVPFDLALRSGLAKKGDWIVKVPGDQLVLTDEEFHERYEADSEQSIVGIEIAPVKSDSIIAPCPYLVPTPTWPVAPWPYIYGPTYMCATLDTTVTL